MSDDLTTQEDGAGSGYGEEDWRGMERVLPHPPAAQEARAQASYTHSSRKDRPLEHPKNSSPFSEESPGQDPQ